MKTFAKPFHELGGVFIDYKANRARALTIRNNVGIQLVSAADGTKKAIQIPAGARVSNAAWSPDSTSVAYLAHTDDASHIWIADVATGKSRQLTKTPVLATLVSNFEYTADGKQIAAVLIPDNRAAMPPAPSAPDGPTVKIADSDKNRLRTFPEPDVDDVSEAAPRVARHRAGRAHRRPEGRREEGRPAGDGSLGRRRHPTASTCASRR